MSCEKEQVWQILIRIQKGKCGRIFGDVTYVYNRVSFSELPSLADALAYDTRDFLTRPFIIGDGL
jgi:hypothetical protein